MAIEANWGATLMQLETLIHPPLLTADVPGLGGCIKAEPEDFEVEENGKTQKISTFVPAGENLAGPQPLPPGIYSNRPQYRSPGGPVTVMLLDAVNTPFSDQGYARRQMLSFVQKQYKPGQKMAIFTLTGPLRVLQDFTSDPQILYTALQRYKPQSQEFASAGQLVTSAASGTPSAGSTVAALDASTAPLTIANGGGLRGSASDQADSVQAALEAFAGAQVRLCGGPEGGIELERCQQLGANSGRPARSQEHHLGDGKPALLAGSREPHHDRCGVGGDLAQP